MNKDTIVKEIYTMVTYYGLMPALYKAIGKQIRLSMGYSKKCVSAPIEELSLSVRSYNALKRAGLDLIGKVIDTLSYKELMKVRNLGKKSLVEIQSRIVDYGFEHLSEPEKKEFIKATLENNGVI